MAASPDDDEAALLAAGRPRDAPFLRRERARALRDQWSRHAKDGETIDVTADTSDSTLRGLLDALFGPDAADLAAPGAERSFAMVAGDAPRDLKFARRFRRLRQVVADVIEGRRSAEPHAPADLLAMMIAARDEKGEALSTDELVDEVMTLVIAGHETTATTLAWIWHLLAAHPAAEARLHREIDASQGPAPGEVPYALLVIQEALRLYPPGWIVTRRALESDVLGDVPIGPGDHVLIPLFLLHRHPDYWSAPDEFRPERFALQGARHPFAYLPFGAGPRRCIGEQLALLQMHIHLVEIAAALRLRRAGSPEIRLDAKVNLRPRDHLLMEAFFRTHA